jgi:hypothetical protein
MVFPSWKDPSQGFYRKPLMFFSYENLLGLGLLYVMCGEPPYELMNIDRIIS